MTGGVRAHSGPAPDPNAIRRDRASDSEWVKLPASGRPGFAPRWPLPTFTDREMQLWGQEWRRPQALMWERNGQEHEVALYVRRLAEAEKPGAQVTLAVLVKQMQEALGLSLPGLARNRWMIVPDSPEPAAREARVASPSRTRFRVLDGTDGA